MSTRLPCCFRVFYDYPSWRTGGGPFVPQVPGYLKTHIIHSFLTILNHENRDVHIVLPSWIYRLFLISRRRLKFLNAPLVRKTPVKISFQSSWFASRTWLYYDEANELAYCHVCMVAYRDGKLNSSNLDKAFILNGFSNWIMLAWPLKTQLFRVPSWFGKGSK